MTVDALRQRRPEVLGDLLDRYGAEIGGVAYLILRDRSAAEDVVMETLVTALERGHELRDPSALRAWLLSIATNHALGMRRRSARVVLMAVLPDLPTVQTGVDAAERATLWDAIGRLAPRMRAAVVLHYYADLPVDGVAAAMGVSPNTVKSQLKVALERLRTSLAGAPGGTAVVGHA